MPLDELLRRLLETVFILFMAIQNIWIIREKPATPIETHSIRSTAKPQTQPTQSPTSQRPDWIKDPEVSWYGPGFYCEHPTEPGCLRTGKIWLNDTACGQLYTKTIIGVAHRTLPCGTLVEFRSEWITIQVPVIDRGPYIKSRTWDLSGGLCRALRHCFTGPIEWRLVDG